MTEKVDRAVIDEHDKTFSHDEQNEERPERR